MISSTLEGRGGGGRLHPRYGVGHFLPRQGRIGPGRLVFSVQRLSRTEGYCRSAAVCKLRTSVLLMWPRSLSVRPDPENATEAGGAMAVMACQVNCRFMKRAVRIAVATAISVGFAWLFVGNTELPAMNSAPMP